MTDSSRREALKVSAAASVAAIGTALLAELAAAQEGGAPGGEGGGGGFGDPRVESLVQRAEQLQIDEAALERFRMSPEDVQKIPAQARNNLCEVYSRLRPLLELILPLLKPGLKWIVVALMTALDSICGIEPQAEQ